MGCPEVAGEIVNKWQTIVDILAELLGVSDALITRIDLPYLEVFKASQNKENIFKEGDRVELAGYFCGDVIKSKKDLLINNAIKDKKWIDYAEVKEGLISYFGLPLKWPDGKLFGTICIHDKKENNFDKNTKKLMIKLKELIEAHLRIINENSELSVQIDETEIKYKKLFNRAPIGIFRSNSFGELLSINPTVVNIMGCSNVSETLKKYNNLAENLYTNPERRADFLKEIENKGEVKNFEMKAQKINGAQIWLSINARISKRYEDGSFEINGFLFDITERKIYEEELQDKNKELQSSYEQLEAYNEEISAMNVELDNSLQEINELNQRFINMIKIVSNLDESSHDTDKYFLSHLLHTAIEIVPEADYGKIFMLESEDRCVIIDAIGHDYNLLKEISFKKEDFNNVNEKGIFYSNDYSFNIKNLSREKKEILKKALKKIKKSIYINIELDAKIICRITLDIAKGKDEEFSDLTEPLLETFASLVSAFFSFQRYNKLQEQFTKELIASIIQMLEMYDNYTSGHSQNVAKLGADIARTMGLSTREIDDIYWTGMVHDIGKLLIPLQILNKNGALTDVEYEQIKKHPLWGFKALSKSESLNQIAKYVLHHHERWDGRGYPDGLKEGEIPLISRILTVADAWDAMTSRRSYRDSLSREKALQEIIENKGKQFAPEVVDIFLSNCT